MKLKLLLIIALLLSHLAGAEKIVVGPGDRIQEAINRSMPGDLIEVQSGTYYENLIVNKTLTLSGVDTGGGKPVIDAPVRGSAATLGEDKIWFEGFVVTIRKMLTLLGTDTGSGKPVINARKRGSAVTLSVDGIRFEGFTVMNSSDSSKPMESKGFYKIEPEGIDPQLAFAGILVDGSKNCTVENNTVILNDVGIHLWKADNNTIRNNMARENTYAGIALSEHCRNNTISGNTAVKSIPGDGIRVSGSNNAFIDNNASDNAFYGIMLWDSPNNILQANIAQNNGYSGLWLMSSSGNSVAENNFIHNNESGISIWYSSNDSSISENDLRNNSRYGIYIKSSSNNSILRNGVMANEGWGIGLDNARENTVEANRVGDNPVGITLFDGSTHNLILNNSVSRSKHYGIQLSDASSNIIAKNQVWRNGGGGIGLYNASDDNRIEGNNASYNLFNGIDLDGCRKDVVRGNRVDYNEWGGIGLYFGCEENSIEDNEIGYNTWSGITLGKCKGNVVTGNNVTRNALGGIKLQGCEDNLLFQNDLIENAMEGSTIRITSPLVESLLESAEDLRDERAKNAYDDARNQWDNGTGGNYYSDFNCTDSDGNGICDSEHAISGGESVDRYPLARPKSSG